MQSPPKVQRSVKVFPQSSGSQLSMPRAMKAAICARVAAEVWPLVSDGLVRTVIDRVIPMSDAAEAHRVMAASEHVGKVLLAV